MNSSTIFNKVDSSLWKQAGEKREKNVYDASSRRSGEIFHQPFRYLWHHFPEIPERTQLFQLKAKLLQHTALEARSSCLFNYKFQLDERFSHVSANCCMFCGIFKPLEDFIMFVESSTRFTVWNFIFLLIASLTSLPELLAVFANL